MGVYATYRVTNMTRQLGGIRRDAAKRAFQQAKLDPAVGCGKQLAVALQARGPPELQEVPAEKRHRLSMREAALM